MENTVLSESNMVAPSVGSLDVSGNFSDKTFKYVDGDSSDDGIKSDVSDGDSEVHFNAVDSVRIFEINGLEFKSNDLNSLFTYLSNNMKRLEGDNVVKLFNVALTAGEIAYLANMSKKELIVLAIKEHQYDFASLLVDHAEDIASYRHGYYHAHNSLVDLFVKHSSKDDISGTCRTPASSLLLKLLGRGVEMTEDAEYYFIGAIVDWFGPRKFNVDALYWIYGYNILNKKYDLSDVCEKLATEASDCTESRWDDYNSFVFEESVENIMDVIPAQLLTC